MTRRMLSVVLGILILSSPLLAQTPIGSKDESREAFIKTRILYTQRLLEGFDCPEGAFPKACQSFRELVIAGDSIVTLPFTALLVSRDPADSVYVLFDDSTDNFWVISFNSINRNNQPSIYLVYLHYHNGFASLVKSARVPLVGGNASFSEKGLSVALIGEMSIMTSETYKNVLGNTMEVKIKVQESTLRQRINWKVDGKAVPAGDGKALRYTPQAVELHEVK